MTNYEISNLKKVNATLASKLKNLEYDVIEYQEMVEKRDREIFQSKNLCEELKLTIKASTGEEPLSLQGVITSLREEVKRLNIELQESTSTLKARNQCLELDITDKSNEISKLTGEISSLKHNILDLQDFIAAERGPRLDALRQLETDLRDKEQEMARQLAESKNASNDAIQAEAKYVSLKLLNEAITSERDDLEHRLKELGLKVEELTSQLTALQCRCNEQENTIKEKADLVKDLEHSVKSKKFALSRYEEDMIVASKEIAVLKSRCEDLDALSNTPCDSDRVSKLEEWKREAEITLESNRKRIELLLSEKENLQSKMKEFVLQEQSLASQLSSIQDEKIALAKSSLEMAEAYEEKIKSLQDDGSRLNELATELEKQKCKYEDAQMAIKSLEMALVVSSCIFCYYIELLHLNVQCFQIVARPLRRNAKGSSVNPRVHCKCYVKSEQSQL